MLEYLALTIIGCLMGVVTGLVPGVHVNTVCLLGLTLYPRLGVNVVEFSVIMISMSVTHTFLDFIPSIFIGVPEEGTALSVLPAHQLVMNGKALEAVKLTGYGSLMGLLFSVLMVIPALVILPMAYEKTRNVIVYVVAASALLLMLREKGVSGKVKSLIIFTAAGAMGAIVLNMKAISETHVLFPVFAGLFGLSNLVYSLRSRVNNIPQEKYVIVKTDRGMLSSGLLGSVGGMVVGLLPAMSPSQIGIIMSEIFGGSVQRFLVSVSAINTADSIFSLVSLYSLGNPRNGVTVMMDKILEVGAHHFMMFTGVVCLTAPIALTAHTFIGRQAMRYFSRVDYSKVSAAIIIFITLLAWVMEGGLGVFIMFLATAIGILPITAGVSRTHLMGVLILPTILLYASI
ncbi:MAG: tripartite tricarboxylate transporter permease [Candidatus Altiarchaeota archaeon]